MVCVCVHTREPWSIVMLSSQIYNSKRNKLDFHISTAFVWLHSIRFSMALLSGARKPQAPGTACWISKGICSCAQNLSFSLHPMGLFEVAGGFMKSCVTWYYQPKKQVITITVFSLLAATSSDCCYNYSCKEGSEEKEYKDSKVSTGRISRIDGRVKQAQDFHSGHHSSCLVNIIISDSKGCSYFCLLWIKDI